MSVDFKKRLVDKVAYEAAAVFDVNKDGVHDIVCGEYWYEGLDFKNKHKICDIPYEYGYYHDFCDYGMDVNGDGQIELITGKRYWAHNGNDPGETDPLGLYYFKINKGEFEKHIIDYGPAGEASGCGIYFWVEDLNGNGRLDIVAPGKEGLFIFENMGQ